MPILRKVKENFIRAVMEQAGVETYITIVEAEKLAAEYSNQDHSVEVLRDAFSRYFVDAKEQFDNTLFRFIINRLRTQKDDFAQDYCIHALTDHPEETSYILRYLGSIKNLSKSMAGVVAFLESGHAVYDYQIYQIFEWLADLSEPTPEQLKSIAREITFDNARPSYLRAVCRQLLGREPLISDFEQIESSYAATHVPLERAQILCDLRKLEAGRRNSFLARARRDDPLCDTAVQLIRNNLL